MADCFEHVNVTSNSIKGREFLDSFSVGLCCTESALSTTTPGAVPICSIVLIIHYTIRTVRRMDCQPDAALPAGSCTVTQIQNCFPNVNSALKQGFLYLTKIYVRTFQVQNCRPKSTPTEHRFPPTDSVHISICFCKIACASALLLLNRNTALSFSLHNFLNVLFFSTVHLCVF